MLPIDAYLKGFVSLIFPGLCVVCKSRLSGSTEVVCTSCRQSLPLTHFNRDPDNPVAKLFWGRCRLEEAHALLFFDKGSAYTRLIHQLKYEGRQDIGIFLGKMLGESIIADSKHLIDAIIPVPLHKHKRRKRGYNQSELIAKGVAEVLSRPVLKDILIRKSHTSTQTRKKRYERWQNVEHVFECTNPQQVSGKHLLIIDDVVTTGATIEATAQSITSVADVKISCATLAYSS